MVTALDLEVSDDLKLRYEGQGFLHLPGVIPPTIVAETQRAFDVASKKHYDIWQGQVSRGEAPKAYYDIPSILDCGDCFVDLVDLDSMMPILLETVGADIQLNHTHARVFPPGKTFTAPWHSDLADVIGIDLGHSHNFFVKVHYFFEDLSPDQGCLAFIPGSHTQPPDRPRPNIRENDPGVVKMVPKAGDAVLFNTHVMHMALDNTSNKTRKSLIYAYSHFWVKNYANAVPTELDKYATTTLRRQMFGVDEEGVSYFDRRYDGSLPGGNPHEQNTFRSASSRLLKRILGKSSVTRK